MRFKRKLVSTAVLCALFTCLFSLSAGASDVSLVDGNSVFFTGLEVKVGSKDTVVVDPDWMGFAADVDIEGLRLRLGAAMDLDLDKDSQQLNYTVGLGANWAKIFSFVAMTEATGMLSIQNTGYGVKIGGIGTVLASTARVGLNLDFGCLPSNFDTYPLILIGREYSVVPGVSDPSGVWWINLEAMFQSYSTRNDSIKLGYGKALGSSDWRGDLGYIMKYSPEGLGLAVQLYTGLAFGAPEITLCNELTLRADITNDSGVEASLVAQNGEGGNFIWVSGGGWVTLLDNYKMSVKLSAPIYGHDKPFEGNELFRPVSSAEIIGAVDFEEGFLSSVNAKYSFNENRFRVGLSSRF